MKEINYKNIKNMPSNDNRKISSSSVKEAGHEKEGKIKVETMHASELVPPRVAASTQSYLDIAEIREGIIVLKNGGLRAVMMVSTLNFALKSTEEQEAIIYAYQSFLNSLEFPIQVVVQSRRMDITKYLDKLRERETEQKTELLKIQTAEYVEYVKQLVELSHIMSKNFFVIVPYSPGEIKKEGLVNKVFSPASMISAKVTEFNSNKVKIMQRVDHISNSIRSVGLRVAQLDTQELIELFYNTYNPATFQQEGLADIDKLDVSAGGFIEEEEGGE